MEVKKIVEGMTAVEVAEVIDSNFKNQNKILEEDIAKQNNVIGVSEYKDFSEAEAVSVGDVRLYNGVLYECIEATTGEFDASKWKKSSFKAETEKKLSELGLEVIYDVTANNNGSTFASLSALLSDENLSTLIPSAIRCGGMSIRFVQSSDNKYVQYRLISDKWSTDLREWKNAKDIIKQFPVSKARTELADDGDFYISDDNGNAIVKFGQGGIKTKNFDSNKTPVCSYNNADLNICDEEGNVIVQFYNGNIKTKNFDSANINFNNANIKRNSIRALFLGNSVSQDHVTYLPFLFKNIFPDIYFEFYICYCGGTSGTIKKYATDIANGTQNIAIFSKAINTEVWTNEENVPFSDVLEIDSFDVISIQPWAYIDIIDDLSYAPVLINHLMTNLNNPFEIGCLINQASNSIPTGAINACKTLIEQNPISMLFPPGIAFEYGRREFGQSFMAQDGTHCSEGLPCMITSYTIFITLCRRLGLYDRVLGNRLRMTQAIWDTLNIPGPNGDLHIGTEEQYLKGQKFAVEAVNIAKHIFNVAVEEKYNNLINN